MYNRDFEGPPLLWSITSVVGGIATAIALICALEYGRTRLPRQSQPLPTSNHLSLNA